MPDLLGHIVEPIGSVRDELHEPLDLLFDLEQGSSPGLDLFLQCFTSVRVLHVECFAKKRAFPKRAAYLVEDIG